MGPDRDGKMEQVRQLIKTGVAPPAHGTKYGQSLGLEPQGGIAISPVLPGLGIVQVVIVVFDEVA
jgi:hypothetical protein